MGEPPPSNDRPPIVHPAAGQGVDGVQLPITGVRTLVPYTRPLAPAFASGNTESMTTIPATHRVTRVPHRSTRHALLVPALLAGLAAMTLPGHAEQNAALEQSPSTAKPAEGTAAPKTPRQILDERYVMGPTASDEFGYRIVWQTEPLATRDSDAQFTTPGRDSIWFADSSGSVVRVRRSNGETVWRASTFKGIERVLGIDHLPLGEHSNCVYVVTQINVVALDALTGAMHKRMNMSQLPTTAPGVFGPYFVYGTRNGLVSWYQYGTGFGWRSTTLGGAVEATPTVAGDLVLAGSTNGTVQALSASSTRIIWERRLSAGVETRIAVDKDAAFVAGRDQSLWAFDLQRGRVLWQYFTQTPLLNDPVRLGDGLYLQIPGEGLVSFNPHPTNRPDGEVRWRSSVPGNVIGTSTTNLLVWDQPTQTLSLVAKENGRVVAQRVLPQVQAITVAPAIDGDLFLTAADGRIQRSQLLLPPPQPATDAHTSAASHTPASNGRLR